MNIIIVDDQDHATILAALRYWQQGLASGAVSEAEESEMWEIATDGGKHEVPDEFYLDELCEGINGGTGVTELTEMTVDVDALDECVKNDIADFLDLDTPEETRERINITSPKEAFHAYCNWHGLLGWGDRLRIAWEDILRASRAGVP